MMRNIYCFNAISKYGTDRLTADYALTDDLAKAEGVLVRSAALHETEFGDSLLAIARAGAGVNIFRWTVAPMRELWCSTPRERMPTVSKSW